MDGPYFNRTIATQTYGGDEETSDERKYLLNVSKRAILNQQRREKLVELKRSYNSFVPKRDHNWRDVGQSISY